MEPSESEKKVGHMGRFEPLLSAKGQCTQPYDEILFEYDGLVVAPTLGSIVPKWLLIIPRAQVINFASLKGASPSTSVGRLLKKLDVSADRAIWFEHGAVEEKSQVGCGVDHAHLHVLLDPPFLFSDFEKAVARASKRYWAASAPMTVYQEIGSEKSYMLAAHADKAIYAEEVESLGSQFFRKVIAELVGAPENWDYKTHANLENVAITKEWAIHTLYPRAA